MSEQCLICLRELSSPCIHCIYQDKKTACPTVIGQCGHKFHKHCITEWIRTGHKTCFAPDCGKDFIPTNDPELLKLIYPEPKKNYSSISSVRIQEELKDIKQMENVLLVLPKEDDLYKFIVKIKVDEGLYRDQWFSFEFLLPSDYPSLNPPKVHLLDKIWHPNITIDGKISMSLLTSHYHSSIYLCDIVNGLKYLLLYPNPKDAMNIEAAAEQEKCYEAFEEHVKHFISAMSSSSSSDDDE